MKDKSNKKEKSMNKSKNDFNNNKNTNSNLINIKKGNIGTIKDWFIFNEDEENIIISPKTNIKDKNSLTNNKQAHIIKENKMKVNYNINSFITSNLRPDLYSPFGIISGNKYRLKKDPEKNFEEKDLPPTLSNEKKDNEEKKILKMKRYYNLETDISLKCKICDQVGHKKDECPFYNSKFCYRCLSNSHNDNNCDLVKCFRCNKLGHKTINCQLKGNKLIICDECHCVGHISKDCLLHKVEISPQFLKNNNLTCLKCGSSNHILCPINKRELPILVNEEKNYVLGEEHFIMNLSNNEHGNNENVHERSSFTPKSGEIEKKIIEIMESVKSKENNENENKDGNEKAKKTKKESKILEGLNNKDFKNMIFCCLCGGKHRNEECKDKFNGNFNNKFDGRRKNEYKSIFNKKNKQKETNNNNRFHFFMKRKRDNNKFYENYINNKNYPKYRDKKNKIPNKSIFKEKNKSPSDERKEKNQSLSLNEHNLNENKNYNFIINDIIIDIRIKF